MEKLKFFVVDDNESFRAGLIFYLEQILKHEVIGEASDGKKFLKQANKFKTADIILMDIQMPEINGILATKQLLWFSHSKKVIAITNLQNSIGLVQFISAGFKACVFKNRVYEDLPHAINAVTNGKMYYPKNLNLEGYIY